MSAASEIVQWVGAGIAALGGTAGIAAFIKARPEARKINADSAQVLSASSVAFVQGVSHEMAALREEIATLRGKIAQQEEKFKRREMQQDRRLRRHERWDVDMVHRLRSQQIDVPDPPPLYPDSTAA